PLSVTRTVTGNVPVADGVQLKAPVEPLIVAPAGAPASNENVSVFAGTSPSVAVAVKVTGVPTVPVLFPIAARTGAWFTSFTVIVIAAVPFIAGDPLSVATMVTGYVPGPCASVGVQLKAPVEAPIVAPGACASVGVQLKAPVEELIVAPVAAGLPNVSDHVCTSPEFGSVAVTVNVSAASSFVVLFPGFVTTGGWLFEPTTMLIASKSFIAGLPLSVTRTVTGNVPLAVGVQLKAPVEPLIVAPAGAPASNENVSVFAGTSPSVAVAVKVTGVPTVPVLFPIAASTGAWFTSFTVIVI